MKDFVTYLSIKDSSKVYQDGYSEGKKVALWSKKGKTLVTADLYAECVNNLEFDLIECLYDDQNSKYDSKKTLRKAFERSKTYLELFFSSENNPIKVNFETVSHSNIKYVYLFKICV